MRAALQMKLLLLSDRVLVAFIWFYLDILAVPSGKKQNTVEWKRETRSVL